MVNPEAPFTEVIGSVQSNDVTFKAGDYIVFIGGTNDIGYKIDDKTILSMYRSLFTSARFIIISINHLVMIMPHFNLTANKL